jgi:hypothetical protein
VSARESHITGNSQHSYGSHEGHESILAVWCRFADLLAGAEALVEHGHEVLRQQVHVGPHGLTGAVPPP